MKKVQDALTKIPGVIDVNVSLKGNSAVIKVTKGKVTRSDLTTTVKEAGFTAKLKN